MKELWTILKDKMRGWTNILIACFKYIKTENYMSSLIAYNFTCQALVPRSWWLIWKIVMIKKLNILLSTSIALFRILTANLWCKNRDDGSLYHYLFTISVSWSFCFTACIKPAATSSSSKNVCFLNNSMLGLDGLHYQNGVQEIKCLTSVKK